MRKIINGGLAERLIAAVLKTAVLERVPGVRIPEPPHFFDNLLSGLSSSVG